MDAGERPWWDETVVLALVFGVVSVPWTYAFVTGEVPLWPSFVASAAVFAAGGGMEGLTRALSALLAGIGYAVATLLLVDAVGGGTVALALVVGAFMLLASLHAKLDWLFAPAGFLGYASLFGVNAAGATVLGFEGLAGVAVATVLAVVVGAHVGWVVDRVSDRLA